MSTPAVENRQSKIETRESITVALAGNPNTGKTTLFNALAGMRQRVGNYPGVTVEMKKGTLHYQGRSLALLDLPGTYSLAPRSPDEMLAVDLLLGQLPGEPRPDLVVTIVDASNLERNLYLMTQVLELGIPLVIALNMIDVAEGQGIQIDAAQLEARLGVPVVPIQANKRKGLEQLKDAIAHAGQEPGLVKGPPFPVAFEREVGKLRELLGSEIPAFLVPRLLLDVGGYTEERLVGRYGASIALQVRAARQRLAEAGCGVPGVEARARYGWIRSLTSGCIHRPEKRPVTWTDRLDRVLTHRLWGTLIFLALMFVVFQSIFTWAKPLMDWIGKGQDFLGEVVGDVLTEPGPLRSLLVEGIIKGVGSVLIFLPQIVILFGFIAVLEDCGYMARAAFLMDKLMARCGLSGKSFIPLLSSVACAVPGIMAARVIENRRDRWATILVAPLMSCSARLPVYLLLIDTFLTVGYPVWLPGLTLFAMYLIGLVVAPLVALLLKRTLLRGETPVFVMEMPVYKWPSGRTVFQRMTGSGWMFIRRAGTLILASMIVVWALLYFPHRQEKSGKTYDELIAREEEKIDKKERKELVDLEEQIADQREELEGLALQARRQGRETEEIRQRRQELEVEIAPVLKQIEPLKKKIDPVDAEINRIQQMWKSQSLLGRMGHAIEPAVQPLGWDWRVGMAAIASFPAREVMVGTMGVIFSQGRGEASDARYRRDIGNTLQEEWKDNPNRVPLALSVMVFFALCCQCASTLAVIRRETNSWRWPLFTFVYMTVLAYIGALVVYQLGSWVS
jgi:ferrous iron transport protein B